MQNFSKLFRYLISLSIIRGENKIMPWWRKDTKEEDKVIFEAAEIVGDALGDADELRRIELKTGKNLRDQVTVGDMEDMTEEVKLRRFGFRRN